MAFDIHVGSFTLNTSTGTQDITGVGFQPKAIIFFGPRQSSTGANSNAGYFIGFASSSTNRACVWNRSNDSSGTSQTYVRHSNVHCIIGTNPTNVIREEVDFDSFLADGFRIDIESANNALIVPFIALGGDLSNVFVKELQSPTTTGTQAYTGVGFQPGCLLAISAGLATAPPAAGDGLKISFGAGTSSTSRWVLSGESVDAQTTSDSYKSLLATKLIHTIQGGAVDIAADIESLDSDGFTLDWENVDGSNQNYCWVLCLKGGQYEVGTDTAKTSTTGTKATTTSFQPTGVVMGSACAASSASIQDDMDIVVGAASGVGEEATGYMYEADGQATTDSGTDINTAKAIEQKQTGTLAAEADLDSFNATDFTLDWTTVDATARGFGWLVFGDSAVGPTPDTAKFLPLLGVG